MPGGLGLSEAFNPQAARRRRVDAPDWTAIKEDKLAGRAGRPGLLRGRTAGSSYPYITCPKS